MTPRRTASRCPSTGWRSQRTHPTFLSGLDSEAALEGGLRLSQLVISACRFEEHTAQDSMRVPTSAHLCHARKINLPVELAASEGYGRVIVNFDCKQIRTVTICATFNTKS